MLLYIMRIIMASALALATVVWGGELAARQQEERDGFIFGSYGRIGFATTEGGRSFTPYAIVSYPPRLFERPYTEIDLAYLLERKEGRHLKVHITTGLMANLFHYTGKPDVVLAVRNLYLEAKGYPFDWLTVWAGSRMYRGDDIYLLDFWPLDMLNTIGVGLVADPGMWEGKLHLGVNRIEDSFQFQEIRVAADLFEPRTVVFMDRQRFIASAKVTRFFLPGGKGNWEKGTKVSLYAEVHSLGEGFY